MFAGAYVFSGFLFILSYLTRPTHPYVQASDPYLYYAVIFGISAVVINLIYAIRKLDSVQLLRS